MNARQRILQALAAGALLLSACAPAWGQTESFEQLRERAERDGTVRVIVQVGARQAFRAEARLTRAQGALQRARIRDVRERVLARSGAQPARIARRFEAAPFVALEADTATLDRLRTDNEVSSIVADALFEPSLDVSVPLIEADTAHAMGINGLGSTIAILDTGVDGTHPFLLGKVVAEACYALSDAGAGTEGGCPNGQSTQLGAGAGVPCTHSSGCIHGTHVAGIAAGSGSAFTGVAPAANLIAIQVFHESQCSLAPCALAWTSDILAGLERVYELRDTYRIAAVNLSLGGGLYNSSCDSTEPAFALAIDNLRAAGIATVVASGNNGSASSLSSPACIAGAVTVGATDDNDAVATFSNAAAGLDLLAPGVSINSSVPGGGFESLSGTSMATPHVAGAYAVLRQAYPTATVDEILTNLKDTGRPVLDQRGATPWTRSRIRLSGALGVTAPTPTVSQVSPATLPHWGKTTTVTITGSGFVRGTYALVNNRPRPATLVDASTMVATVLASDLATTAQSLSVGVATPAPGGGASSLAQIALVPPVFTFSATTAHPGETITVSWTGAPTANGAWIAFTPVGESDGAYARWSYLATLTSNSWNIVMPLATGNYEIRVYADATLNQRIITAGPVAVTAGPAPPVTAVLSVSATQVAPGQSVTVSLTGGTGGAQDWLALARVGAPASSYLRWAWVGAGRTAVDWTVAMPTTPGQYEFRLFANGDLTVVTSPIVTVSGETTPTVQLNVSATSVGPGGSITLNATSTSAFAATDWLALASVNAGPNSYSQWTYVSGGLTSFNWTVTMPATAGEYEFRFFRNNGTTIAARSASVTVTSSAPPPNPATLTVNTTTATPGTPLTVTLTGGSGNATNWLALARVGSGEAAYSQWTYVPAGQATFAWTVPAPAASGDYEFRFYLNGGYTRSATSPTVTVGAPPPPPTTAALSVDTQLAAPGAPITVTLTGGSGGATDWLSFARVGTPSSSYWSYVYVGAGVTTRTWTVNAPTTAGDYEFRFLPNNGLQVTATSPTVAVRTAEAPPPTLVVDRVTAAPGEAVTLTALSTTPFASTDWIALARVGTVETAYLKWTYVAGGQTTYAWTVTMPTMPGSYEFRMYRNNGSTRIATSAAVNVQ